MRFDDRIATVLRQPLDTPVARAVAWRQAIDLLAQGRGDGGVDEAYDMVRHLRGQVPAEIRAEAARALSGRRVPAPLVRLFAEEPPPIAAIALGQMRLSADEWVALLPDLGPTARGFVRNRRDLAPAVMQALESFGASDLVLGGPVGEPGVDLIPEPLEQASTSGVSAEAAPDALADEASEAASETMLPPDEPGPTSIGDVMARIEAYRQRPATERPRPAVMPALGHFRFETDTAGTIVWTDAEPRGPVIGETISRVGERDGGGVDGQAAGAFRGRAAFRDARLTLAGEGLLAGAWRISAVPAFDQDSGRFTGYRGVARRPRVDEDAEARAAALPFGLGFHPDSLRQLVHELRTPINAIVGFAELIEQQMLGPAALDYRVRASTIAREGHRLLDAVEDLDSAARIGARRWTIDKGTTDAVAVLARLKAELAPLAAARGVSIVIEAGSVGPVDADAVAVERMVTRLVQAVLGLARTGETVNVTLAQHDGCAVLEVARPTVLEGRDERALLDPGYAPDGDWPDAPVLGLGFALRLVRNLASAARGGLTIGADRFRLHLPIRDGHTGVESSRG